MTDRFQRFAVLTSAALGSVWFFALNVLLALAWTLIWWLRGFDDWFQLACTTALTITTWLLLILVQRTQNHDARAMALKLDEVLLALHDARNDLIGLEAQPEAALDAEERRLHDAANAQRRDDDDA